MDDLYNPGPINAAIGAKRLTNKKLAKEASVAPSTVSAIRNGNSKVILSNLKAVAAAAGLEMEITFKPKPESIAP